MSALLAGFFAVMAALTGTNYFYHTMISMAVDDIAPIRQFHRYAPFVYKGLYGLILALPVAAGLLLVRRRGHFLLLYFAVCAVWTFVSTGKYGAGNNYVAEPAILSLVIVAVSLAPTQRRDLFAIVPILILLCCQGYMTLVEYGLQGDGIAVKIENLDSRVAHYRAMPGRKLITHEKLAIHVGDPVGFDWFLLKHLEEKGLLDLSPLYRQIAEGEFAVCVFVKPRTAEIEDRLARLVAKGPYKFSYFDAGIVEFVRVGDSGTSSASATNSSPTAVGTSP